MSQTIEAVNDATISFSNRKYVGIVLLSWLAVVGFDLFQGAGVLAKLWLESKSVLLPPDKLFQRIPLGYLAFLMTVIMFTWLMVRLKVSGWKQGALFGVQLGGLLSICWVLGIASVFPLKRALLIASFFSGIVQHTIATTVIGCGLGGLHLGRLTAIVIAFVILLVIATVVLQNQGFAPAMQYRG